MGGMGREETLAELSEVWVHAKPSDIQTLTILRVRGFIPEISTRFVFLGG
jgi:hypothetical protein